MLSRVGLPVVFECTTGSEARDVETIVEVARDASALLSEILGISLRADRIDHWEHSGGFNLYALGLGSPFGMVGEMRVVERGSMIVNVSGAISERLRTLSPTSWDRLTAGEGLSIGYNIGMVLLRGDGQRWPAGQKEAKRFAIYAAEGIQWIDAASWRLKISAGEREVSLSMVELERMAEDFAEKDFHCVTGWSVRGNSWRGVRIKDLAKLVGAPQEGWLVAVSSGGYSAAVPIEEAMREDSIVAIGLNGSPLSREGGYPARLILPRLYGWKGTKWLSEMLFVRDYVDGYWEALAYHERGLVEAEERFKIRNPLIAKHGLPPMSPPRAPPRF